MSKNSQVSCDVSNNQKALLVLMRNQEKPKHAVDDQLHQMLVVADLIGRFTLVDAAVVGSDLRYEKEAVHRRHCDNSQPRRGLGGQALWGNVRPGYIEWGVSSGSQTRELSSVSHHHWHHLEGSQQRGNCAMQQKFTVTCF